MALAAPADDFDRQALQCPRCQSRALTFSGKAISCDRCAALFPVVHGVPIMFEDVLVAKRPHPPPATLCLDVAAIYDLPQTPEVLAHIQEILWVEYVPGEATLQAEGSQFLHRLSVSGFKLSGLPQRRPSPRIKLRERLNVPELTRYRFLRDYLPRCMQAGTTVVGNVRLENCGASTISSQHRPPAKLSYHWLDARGAVVVAEGARTPLPVAMAPARQLTVPMVVETPREPGQYWLELTVVLERVAWLDEFSHRVPVRVTREAPPSLTTGWEMRRLPPAPYGEDHRRGAEMLREYLEKGGRRERRVLEIGGSAAPVAPWLTPQPFNLDVDIPALQIAAWKARREGLRPTYIAGDAAAPPFADHYFDAIVMFSTLHHLPHPERALRALRGKLRAGGILAALCEPIGHYLGDEIAPEILGELQVGLNEQSFGLEEYARMFRAAGLEMGRIVVDDGSLKAFLRVAGS